MPISIRILPLLFCTAAACCLTGTTSAHAQQDVADNTITEIVDDVVESTVRANRERLAKITEPTTTEPVSRPASDSEPLPWLTPEESRQWSRARNTEQERELRELEHERDRELAELRAEYRRESAEGNRTKNLEKLRRKLEQKKRFFEQKREHILNKTRERSIE